MNVVIKGRHLDVDDAIRDYAEEKIGRISKVLNGMLIGIEVELHSERNPSIENGQIAEVTVYTKGPTIRAKEAASDMHAAIDLVSDKLERRVRRFKDKVVDRHSARAAAAVSAKVGALTEESEEEPTIVKSKHVELKPMTTDEAILQMELLGHDFFLFASVETDQVSVLYRRRDGDYGLIEPRVG